MVSIIESVVSIFLIVSCLILHASSDTGCDPWPETQYARDTNNVVEPVKFYQSGPGGRPQYMMAFLKSVQASNYAKMGSAPDAKIGAAVRDKGDKQGTNNLDHAGHLLAARLGGSGKDSRNLFPQNANCNTGAWRSFPEDDVANLLKTNDLEYSVKLYYADDKATRPHRLVACYSRSTKKSAEKNFFCLKNPLHTDVPNTCSTGPAGFGKISKADFNDPFFKTCSQ